MENLLECNGRRFKAKNNDCPIEGVISVENGQVFLCSNNLKEQGYKSTEVFKLSWFHSNITDLELLADEPKEGDYVYISNDYPDCNDKKKRIFLAKVKNFNICVDQSYEEDYKADTYFEVASWKYMQPIQKEDIITEITADEALEIVAKQKGIDVKNLRLKK